MLDKNAPRRGLLIDLDGVIYQGGRLIKGATDTLAWIDDHDLPHLFLTNTTSRSRDALLQKFEAMGFGARAEQLMTPAIAASQWLREHRLRRVALFVPQSTRDDFGEFEAVDAERGEAVDAVIVGDLGESWDFRRLNRAFQLLMQTPSPRLIALGMTRYWRNENGLQLDVAPFVKALEHAASCEAVVVGKPAPAFFAAALEALRCDAGQALMIGDDIVGDVDAAQQCGIRGVQVKTGKFREADLHGAIKPCAVIDSIAGLPEWWERATGLGGCLASPGGNAPTEGLDGPAA